MTFWNPAADTTPAGTAIAMASGDTLYLRAGISLGSGGTGGSTGVTATAHTQSLIFGNLQSLSGLAFHATSFSNTMTIGASGIVWGLAGARFDGKDNHISNAGLIVGYSGFGLTIDGSDGHLLNSGTIQGGTDALFLSFGGHVVVNSGLISSLGDFGVNVNAVLGAGTNTIDNSGTIECAGGTAIFAGDAVTLVANTGHIHGDIEFGADNDSYEGWGGRIVGVVRGGNGDDDITTGVGRDTIVGGRGSDALEGGAGRDTFVYTAVIESAGNVHDTISGFDPLRDVIDLDAVVTGIDATVAAGNLDAGAGFSNDLVAAITAAKLAVGHAVLFTPNSGTLEGHVILIVDRNGIAGYQKNKDYVFDVTDNDNIGALDTGDFI